MKHLKRLETISKEDRQITSKNLSISLVNFSVHELQNSN